MPAVTDLPAYKPRPAHAKLALNGLRIVDFSHFVAGPYCTAILADLGADVMKIENAARGDDFRAARRAQIGGEGGPFLWANRNKRSIALDMSVPEGREIAREMIRRADVVVENFSAGVMEKFGLDYATVSSDNPRLIYCSISACGREGPLASRIGFDPIAQAETGLMSINAVPDGPPTTYGTPIVDMTTGMTASTAILAALHAREQYGHGQRVEVAMFDQGITMLGYDATNYLISGQNQLRPRLPPSVPVGSFETLDHGIFVCCANDRTYHRLAVQALGRPDLSESPDYTLNIDRVNNSEKLLPILRDIFKTETRETWLARLRAAGVPVAPIATIEEAVTSAEAAERGLISQIPHPTVGAVPNIASPIRLSETPVVDPRAAPLLGQHTDELLSQVMGYDAEQIAALERSGALGKRRMPA
ncbi:MAG: CaiB/BaiF CoA transferase family protein [Janthinobacterium lividum]